MHMSLTEFKLNNQMCRNKTPESLLLTNVSYFICHHVLIVVDSGVWNICLVSHRHNVQFLERQ